MTKSSSLQKCGISCCHASRQDKPGDTIVGQEFCQVRWSERVLKRNKKLTRWGIMDENDRRGRRSTKSLEPYKRDLFKAQTEDKRLQTIVEQVG